MKLSGKALVMVTVLTLLMVIGGNLASAQERDQPTETSDADKGHVEELQPSKTLPPTPGHAPDAGRPIGEDAFVGPTEVRHEVTTECSSGENCPDHFSVIPHTHVVDRITRRWDGNYGEQSLGGAMWGPGTLIFHETMSWSHNFSVSIGFDKAPINGAVGYDITYSSSQTYEYQFPVNAGERKQVHKKDWYHITDMDVSTHYIYCTTVPCSTSVERGTAWAGQFFLREIWAKNV